MVGVWNVKVGGKNCISFHNVQGLYGKYLSILNISRTVCVALMLLRSQSGETLLRIRDQSLSRGASQSTVRRR